MKTRRIAMLLFVLLSACAQQPMRSSVAPSALEKWVNEELSPYLAQQLSRHPRFKGEPVLLLRLKDQDIQPDIDGLSDSMRARIRDALLGTPGVNLPWQPLQRDQRHHRRLADLECGRIRAASYYIGIDISAISGGRHRVSLRALDVRARQWVGGISKSWQGELTVDELRSLGQLRADEALRGLRALPFGPDQVDLAADYLANNLSCLLRQQDQGELVIHLTSLVSQDSVFPGLLKLVGNNLSRYREVRVTERQSEAGFTLRGEAHKLADGLYQVWLVLQPRRSGLHLPGMDTATYIDTAAVRRVARQRAPAPPPAITRMHLSDERGSACAPAGAVAGCRSLQVELNNAQRLFVIVHSRKAGLARLLPGACASAAVGGKRRYRLSGLERGVGTYYGIAVHDSRLQREFSQHLRQLPDACAAGETLPKERTAPWLDRLDRIIADNPGRVAWAASRGGAE